MRRTNIKNADYIVKVESEKRENGIKTLEIYDVRNNKYINFEEEKPALNWFLNLNDLKESLNWCLNCYADKMSVVWKNTNKKSYGTVYLVA